MHLPAPNRSRRLPLALAIVALFGLSEAHAVDVTSCTDNGPSDTGNLRNVIAAAGEGANVDLTRLSCSAITLTQGEIVINQNSINLLGPGQENLAIQPKLSARTRVFDHTGTGTLWMNGLTVKFGYTNASSPVSMGGACIRSNGNVSVLRSTVKNCAAVDNLDPDGYYYTVARGGGIYAKGDLFLYRSSVSYNLVVAANDKARTYGGGAYVNGSADVYASSVSGNQAQTGSFSATLNRFGGLAIKGGARIRSSTISGNTAGVDAGLGIEGASYGAKSTVAIINSTISGNHASGNYYLGGGLRGGMFCEYCNASIFNSTIAFNRADRSASTSSAGLTLKFSTITMQSSLLSNNTSGSPASADDFKNNGYPYWSGSNNLIVASSSFVPSGTLSSCPLLGSLRDNGGLTKTHALLSRSPAIDAGNNVGQDPGTGQPPSSDQRGSSRLSGGAVDIGAYEVQQGDVLFNNGFDGCG